MNTPRMQPTPEQNRIKREVVIVGDHQNMDKIFIEKFLSFLLDLQKKIAVGHKLGDCATIATRALIPVRQFADGNYKRVDTISVDEKNVIPKFRRQGLTTHTINYVEMKDGTVIGFDLTSEYNEPNDPHKISVFISKSVDDLKRQLKYHYRSNHKWKTSLE